jgi:SAM-dependent methyltransferase
MLQVAQQKGERFLSVMDAQQLGIRTASFDLAVLLFILFHLPNPQAGLAEAARVLRSGGAIGMTTWAEDPALPGMAIWNEELDSAGAGPDPRDPAVMQQRLVGNRETIAHMLEEEGFKPIELWTQRFEHRWDHESLLALQLGCGMARRRISTLDQERKALCIQRVRERLVEIPVHELVWRPEVLFSVGTARG